MSARLRFAPSPTGPLHIGGVRTALYNYLLAKKLGGEFILRIEDTDQNRYVEGAEDYIQEALAWVGINFDESPKLGGEHAPYKQSERKAIYAEYAQQLIDSGKAYYAFDTTDELDALRERLIAEKVDNPSYNSVTRMQMKNSLTLSADEVEKRRANGESCVIRLKVPIKEEVRFKDMIRDWVVVHSSTIDDKVLLKADGMPTYHLANIVDDHLMGITHVIRGEEWLPSAPLHILLYRAFGWEHPEFAHLPLLLKPEGSGKLSKRDGLLGDFPIFPLQWTDPESGDVARGFREDGYLPQAMVNFLAFLGWNPGTEQELFTMEELIESFSIERVNGSGARFDIQKAQWYNQQYLRALPDEELVELAKANAETEITDEFAASLVKLLKDRVTFPKEFITEAPYLFEAPTKYEEAIAAKQWNDQAKTAMPLIIEALQSVEDFNSQQIHDAIFENLTAAEIKPGKVMQALRLAVSGQGRGADLMLTLEILGKTEVISRIEKALELL
ncbi:MAG: glutamate--tRNA ligase [Spirosomaceae bacterium]|nr:glutamate--tRNA ligase [Spirosomataceae bacterium]